MVKISLETQFYITVILRLWVMVGWCQKINVINADFRDTTQRFRPIYARYGNLNKFLSFYARDLNFFLNESL